MSYFFTKTDEIIPLSTFYKVFPVRKIHESGLIDFGDKRGCGFIILLGQKDVLRLSVLIFKAMKTVALQGFILSATYSVRQHGKHKRLCLSVNVTLKDKKKALSSSSDQEPLMASRQDADICQKTARRLLQVIREESVKLKLKTVIAKKSSVVRTIKEMFWPIIEEQNQSPVEGEDDNEVWETYGGITKFLTSGITFLPHRNLLLSSAGQTFGMFSGSRRNQAKSGYNGEDLAVEVQEKLNGMVASESELGHFVVTIGRDIDLSSSTLPKFFQKKTTISHESVLVGMKAFTLREMPLHDKNSKTSSLGTLNEAQATFSQEVKALSLLSALIPNLDWSLLDAGWEEFSSKNILGSWSLKTLSEQGYAETVFADFTD